MNTLETLQAHAIDQIITFDEIAPNYPVIRVKNSAATATIALHGAHVIDYIPTGQKPVVFTSKEAIYTEGTAIRGGIPICWPWFNAHPTDSTVPSHGYARIEFWKLNKTSDTAEGSTLELSFTKDNLLTELTIIVGKSLSLQLKTTNIGTGTETVGGALHTYFNISDIRNVSLSGLDGVNKIDMFTHTPGVQSGELCFDEEINLVYINSPHTSTIHDKAWNRDIIIEKTGSLSTVVWNPWIETAIAFKDLADEEYKDFLCVEASNAYEDVYELTPGSSHTLGTKITSV